MKRKVSIAYNWRFQLNIHKIPFWIIIKFFFSQIILEPNQNGTKKRMTMATMRRLTVVRTSLLPTRSTSVQALRRQTKNFLRNSFGSNQNVNEPIASTSTSTATTSTNTTATVAPKIVVTKVSPKKETKVKVLTQPTTSNENGTETVDTATSTNTDAAAQIKPPQEEPKNEKTNQNNKITRNMFQCEVCKKTCQTELSLKIHMNYHPSTVAKKATTESKFLMPSNNNVISSGASLKCKYCDRQFRVAIALEKHIELNCEKIPALERKRIMSKGDIKIKTGSGNVMNHSSENRHKNRPSVINESGENMSSNEHSGIFRTPSKMIRCKLCNDMFLNCVEYAEHCSNNHP